ncbi:hypothetical protein [Streptomyces sp. NPDC092370]|uniref:hypothetical protein n=1 Tax=Streptomyces sp. NPDC092370 TaxID=3366016 RepID=UPI0037FDDA3C
MDDDAGHHRRHRFQRRHHERPMGPCTADNGNRTGTTHRIDTAGRHMPSFWLVLNKIVTTQAV